jgi:predicted Rossmann fold nucleotide-binding protein DprA/Smf involved in DNA uptake
MNEEHHFVVEAEIKMKSVFTACFALSMVKHHAAVKKKIEA